MIRLQEKLERLKRIDCNEMARDAALIVGSIITGLVLMYYLFLPCVGLVLEFICAGGAG